MISGGAIQKLFEFHSLNCVKNYGKHVMIIIIVLLTGVILLASVVTVWWMKFTVVKYRS